MSGPELVPEVVAWPEGASDPPTLKQQTQDLKRRILVKYQNGYLCLFEVPVDKLVPEGKAKGRRGRRLVDAVAVGMWPSTKHIIHGFEVKVSRADLRSELQSPEKAGAAEREVDRFWLVVPSLELITGVGRQEDLLPKIPPSWGILSASDGASPDSLRQVRAPKGRAPVDTASRRLLVALLSKAGSSVLETVELQPQGTPYQRKKARRSRTTRRAQAA